MRSRRVESLSLILLDHVLLISLTGFPPEGNGTEVGYCYEGCDDGTVKGRVGEGAPLVGDEAEDSGGNGLGHGDAEEVN